MDSEIDRTIAALARHDIEVTVLDDLARVEVDGRVLDRRWVTKADYPLPDSEPVLVLGGDIPPRLIATIRANGDRMPTYAGTPTSPHQEFASTFEASARPRRQHASRPQRTSSARGARRWCSAS